MELFTLQCLCKTLQEGGLAPAAQALGIRQEALEQLMINLETELKVPLFQREQGKLLLNSTGRRYSDRVRQALCMLEDAALQAASAREDLHGTVRLGLLATPPELPALLSYFSNAFPRIRLQFEEYSPAEEYDLLLAADPLPALPAPYTNLALVQEEMVIVISKQHAWATRRRCQLHELRNQPIAMPNPGHSTLSGYLRGLFAKNPPHIAFWAPSILQMMIFVRNGACTVLPLALAECICKEDPSLRLVHFGKQPPERTYRILRREDVPLPAIAHRFLDYAQQFYRVQP